MALTLLLALTQRGVAAQPATLHVQTDQPGAAPTQIGVFFEDVNYGADGGLYPERIKNRSFEFRDPLMGWHELGGSSDPRAHAAGSLKIEHERPLAASNPHYLRLQVEVPGEGFGVSNEGFFGIGVKAGQVFDFSVQARSPDAEPPQLRVEIEGADGAILAQGRLSGFGAEWATYHVELRSKATDPKARLNLRGLTRGTLDLDMVSLFPRGTFKNRDNGLRADLAQLLADLKPAFMRFPGGCIVEGHDLSGRHQWKTTIGGLHERRLILNRWNDEFKHRPAPDYFQSFGLGFFEYFQLCEDLGASPLPVLNCGMACQFNTGELAPLDQLDPFIQDALDLVEFANGPVGSPWGARRAALGHPAPFGMKLLGVGNEQWGTQYLERYAKFADALRARYPDVQLVSGAGPSPADDRYRLAWTKLRELKADIVDEHCYDRPDWFFQNAVRYDHFDHTGPKVFMGEYAAQSVKVVSPQNRNDWLCALSEAAFLTGLQRNSEVVIMASYAPLLAHAQGWQWTPNLIWFDNLRAYGTPSYYVQQLFSLYRGTRVLPVSLGEGNHQLYAAASRDEKSGEIIVKVVNAAPTEREVNIDLDGAKSLRKGATAHAVVLASADLRAENSFDAPTRVSPVSAPFTVASLSFTRQLPGYSLTVLRIPGVK